MSENIHKFVERIVTSLHESISKLNTFQKGTYLEEELQSSFFVFNVRIVTHFLKEFILDTFKVVSENVIKDLLMYHSD